MIKQLLSSLNSYEFIFKTFRYKNYEVLEKYLIIEPKDFYGTIKIYYSNTKDLKQRLLSQAMTNPAIMYNI